MRDKLLQIRWNLLAVVVDIIQKIIDAACVFFTCAIIYCWQSVPDSICKWIKPALFYNTSAWRLSISEKQGWAKNKLVAAAGSKKGIYDLMPAGVLAHSDAYSSLSVRQIRLACNKSGSVFCIGNIFLLPRESQVCRKKRSIGNLKALYFLASANFIWSGHDCWRRFLCFSGQGVQRGWYVCTGFDGCCSGTRNVNRAILRGIVGALSIQRRYSTVCACCIPKELAHDHGWMVNYFDRFGVSRYAG